MTTYDDLLPLKRLETMHVEFCQNGSKIISRRLIRCHRYSTEILLAAAIEEALKLHPLSKSSSLLEPSAHVAKEPHC